MHYLCFSLEYQSHENRNCLIHHRQPRAWHSMYLINKTILPMESTAFIHFSFLSFILTINANMSFKTNSNQIFFLFCMSGSTLFFQRNHSVGRHPVLIPGTYYPSGPESKHETTDCMRGGEDDGQPENQWHDYTSPDPLFLTFEFEGRPRNLCQLIFCHLLNLSIT